MQYGLQRRGVTTRPSSSLESLGLLPKTVQSCPDTLPVVKSRPDVEVEARDVGAPRVGLAGVEVDDIPDLRTAAVDVPVVAVEGGRVSVGSVADDSQVPTQTTT
jgi:hypothetical protein